MVTADSLNLDVLEQICSFLCEDDLPSSALVSQSFFAATTPRLYHTISFGLRHSTGYGNTGVMSPFATLIARPLLAVHVRHIEIRIVPRIKSSPHPVFMRECREALILCINLTRFKCTMTHILPILLPSLQQRTQLRDLSVYSNLTTLQAKMLTSIKNLTNVSLEFASSNIVVNLPAWMQTLSNTLTCLTLYMINDLHENVLRAALIHLPNLRGLNVIGCPKVDHPSVLGLLRHTPLLENLSMTASENKEGIPCSTPSLHHLQHLALDMKYAMNPPSSPSLLGSILTQIRPLAPSLTSFALKLPVGKLEVGETFVSQLVDKYAFTLKRLSFLDCNLNLESIEKICKSCIHLEELHVAIPMKDLAPFAQRISLSKTLNTLVDVDNHIEHGVRSALGREDVRYLMSLSTLRTIITTYRIWTGTVEDHGFIEVSLKKRYPHKLNSLWFMPKD